MHFKAVDGLCVRTHHDTGVVDEDVKVVDLWAGGRILLVSERIGFRSVAMSPWWWLCTHRLKTSGQRLLWSRCRPGPAPGPPPELWGERLVCWPPPPLLCPHLGMPWWLVHLLSGQKGFKIIIIPSAYHFSEWMLQLWMALFPWSPFDEML